MIKLANAALLLLLLAGPAVLAACSGTPATPADVEPQLYTCGMHPEVVQEGPGSCPICGMDLVPMSAERAGREAHVGHDHASSDAVVVSPDMVQSIGVRTAPVERQTLFKHLRTVGEVDVAEDKVSVVNLRLSGWAERVRVQRNGDPVRRGQVLFDLYSPDLVAAQEELLLASRTDGADSPLAQAARRRLELWDIAPGDIRAVEAAGVASRTLPVRSPSSGFVLAKDVVEGARIAEGQDLYRIGDLQKIWVTAQIYEFDAPWIEEGQPATMELPFQRGDVVAGQVSYIYPTLTEVTRTLPVRLEFENPGVRLKPGMFTTVRIQFRRKDDVLGIPAEAILHTGEREVVFISEGGGRFTPRTIRTGLVADRQLTEVLEGLEPGEVVVTSGQFLLDSESRLQGALEKLRDTRPADVPDGDRTTVYSCPMHPEILGEADDRCPICGMDLEERPGTAAELGHETPSGTPE